MRLTLLMPTLLTQFMSAAAVLGILTATGHAQFTEVVAEDDFDSYTDTTFVVASDGATALVPDSGGGNAVQYTVTTDGDGGFFASGFDWLPIVQPGAGGANQSTDRSLYQVSFDLTIDSAYVPGNGFEVWAKDEAGEGDPEGDPSASLYSVGLGTFTTGVSQPVTFTLDTSVNDAPFAHEDGSGFIPTVDEIQVRFNGLDFDAPASTEFAFTVDNFSLATVPEPGSLLSLGVASAVGLCFGQRRRSSRAAGRRRRSVEGFGFTRPSLLESTLYREEA